MRSKFHAMTEGRGEGITADIEHVVKGFIPPSYPLEIELQNLVAVQECTSRSRLLEAFQQLEREFVTRRMKEIKALLEERLRRSCSGPRSLPRIPALNRLSVERVGKLPDELRVQGCDV